MDPLLTPTPEDLQRDLRADLATCAAATPPPWSAGEGDARSNVVLGPGELRIVVTRAGDFYSAWKDDAEFVACACAGWPAALRRALLAEAGVEALLATIRRHRDYRGDHRCWQDDAELYAALPEGAPDPATLALHSPQEMLENCKRYLASRQPGGIPYVSPQVEIERLTAEHAAFLAQLTEHLDDALIPCTDMNGRPRDLPMRVQALFGAFHAVVTEVVRAHAECDRLRAEVGRLRDGGE